MTQNGYLNLKNSRFINNGKNSLLHLNFYQE